MHKNLDAWNLCFLLLLFHSFGLCSYFWDVIEETICLPNICFYSHYHIKRMHCSYFKNTSNNFTAIKRRKSTCGETLNMRRKQHSNSNLTKRLQGRVFGCTFVARQPFLHGTVSKQNIDSKESMVQIFEIRNIIPELIILPQESS